MRKLFPAVLCLLASFAANLMAAEHWIRLTTPHFEMYTTNGEKQATEALKIFEQVRYFFLESSHSKVAPATPVRIIAFRSEKEFKPYRLNEGSFAYYLRTRKFDYIVMQDINSDHYQAAAHEYTHLIVQNHELKLPVWLNEGLADLYSSMESKGDKTIVGRPLTNSVMLLMSQSWLDLNFLFNVQQDSPYYNERDKMSIFYSESWALTHMLMLSAQYKPFFSKFLSEVASGRPVPESLLSAFNKTVPEVTKDLHLYLSQTSVQAAVYDVKLTKQDLEPEVSEPGDFNINLALTDLLASQKRTQPEASERLAKMAQEHPESAEVEESIGYLEWEQGHEAKARECFQLARDRGSKNPEMLTHYAYLLEMSGVPAGQVMPILQQVVAIKPDYPDGWLTLGIIATRADKFGIALGAFSHITNIAPDHAYDLFANQAYCDLRLNSPKAARETAEKASGYAKTPEQKAQISNFLLHLASDDHPPLEAQPSAATIANPEPATGTEAPEKPLLKRRPVEIPRDQPTVHSSPDLQHVEGVTKTFDCARHRLRVTVNSQEMIFQLDDPERIIVRNSAHGFIDFQCGAQKPVKVGVFYLPLPQPASADGTIQELVF